MKGGLQFGSVLLWFMIGSCCCAGEELCEPDIFDGPRSDGGLTIILSTERDVFVAGEPIVVRMTLKNTGTRSMPTGGFGPDVDGQSYLGNEAIYMYTFVRIDRAIPCERSYDPPFIPQVPPDYLSPGQNFEMTCDLRRALGFSVLPTGESHVWVTYDVYGPHKEPGRPLLALTAHVVSNSLTIRILSPCGQSPGRGKKRGQVHFRPGMTGPTSSCTAVQDSATALAWPRPASTRRSGTTSTPVFVAASAWARRSTVIRCGTTSTPPSPAAIPSCPPGWERNTRRSTP